MRKINTTVLDVEKKSLAQKAKIKKGDKILKINGHEFYDILEYRFLISEFEVTLDIEKADGSFDTVTLQTDYQDPGIIFEDELICKAQSCHNKCIFCFIDQLPKNMREPVYFKDDDARLSFLQGNYVTLTNMSDEEIDRLIAMRISPINISVHATNPKLREMMLNNRFAGKCYSIMQKLAKNEIYMNCQIVLCPEINDGDELLRSLSDMEALYPYVSSISVVPVGLTAHREGLYPIKPFDPKMCLEVIKAVTKLQEEFLEKHGSRIVYLADEFYIGACIEIPDAESYEGFPQLENGVGLIASMKEEFSHAITLIPKKERKRNISIVTGELAAPFIKNLAKTIEEISAGIKISVFPIKNNFFGGGVNVAGLVCGQDILNQLKNKNLGDEILIPYSMLRDDEDIFLDDVTTKDIEKAFSVKVIPVLNDGYDFVEKVLGEELEF